MAFLAVVADDVFGGGGGASDVLDPILAPLKSILGPTVNVIEEAVKVIGDVVQDVEEIIKLIESAIKEIVNLLKGSELDDLIVRPIKRLLGGLGDALTSVITITLSELSSADHVLSDEVKTSIRTTIRDFFGSIRDGLSFFDEIMTDARRSLSDSSMTVDNMTVNLLATVVDSTNLIETSIRVATNKINQELREIWKDAENRASTMTGEIYLEVKDIFSGVLELIRSLYRDVKSVYCTSRTQTQRIFNMLGIHMINLDNVIPSLERLITKKQNLLMQQVDAGRGKVVRAMAKTKTDVKQVITRGEKDICSTIDRTRTVVGAVSMIAAIAAVGCITVVTLKEVDRSNLSDHSESTE